MDYPCLGIWLLRDQFQQVLDVTGPNVAIPVEVVQPEGRLHLVLLGGPRRHDVEEVDNTVRSWPTQSSGYVRAGDSKPEALAVARTVAFRVSKLQADFEDHLGRDKADHDEYEVDGILPVCNCARWVSYLGHTAVVGLARAPNMVGM